MPTYQYLCTECGEPHEQFQSFTDDPLTVCPACGGRLRKVFSAVGVVFKGSGFYRTDSRAENGKKSSSVPAASSDSKSEGKSGGTSEAKSDGGSGRVRVRVGLRVRVRVGLGVKQHQGRDSRGQDGLQLVHRKPQHLLTSTAGPGARQPR